MNENNNEYDSKQERAKDQDQHQHQQISVYGDGDRDYLEIGIEKSVMKDNSDCTTLRSARDRKIEKIDYFTEKGDESSESSESRDINENETEGGDDRGDNSNDYYGCGSKYYDYGDGKYCTEREDGDSGDYYNTYGSKFSEFSDRSECSDESERGNDEDGMGRIDRRKFDRGRKIVEKRENNDRKGKESDGKMMEKRCFVEKMTVQGCMESKKLVENEKILGKIYLVLKEKKKIGDSRNVNGIKNENRIDLKNEIINILFEWKECIEEEKRDMYCGERMDCRGSVIKLDGNQKGNDRSFDENEEESELAEEEELELNVCNRKLDEKKGNDDITGTLSLQGEKIDGKCEKSSENDGISAETGKFLIYFMIYLGNLFSLVVIRDIIHDKDVRKENIMDVYCDVGKKKEFEKRNNSERMDRIFVV